ncbi:MAG: hydrogenase formation protein HypD [Alphaproteobacteria bacterium]|uniref:Hydrogenase formation protein HypD n=1 Tax=Candidatus Nitrobium versatile TaxID=2884831 RepID=A0A953J7Z8_9BACT|nr:hydrogenase formation protein HypD [Candidatus Nitrobium versatile]
MKYIDEFRNRDLAQGILKRIHEISKRDVSIMEICGSHTHSISKYGIRDALPSTLRLISGPGCPVCVSSAGDLNRIIEFVRKRGDVIITTFGDMMRVPGSASSFQEEKARGSDIRVVYSPMDTLEIARANPGKEVIFYAVGFETTAPTVAASLLMAKQSGLKNLSFLCLHKLTPPAMRALLDGGEVELNGFLCPGHVTTVIGAGAYRFIADTYHSPCVVAGFEPLDVLQGLYMLVRQIEEGRSDIEIQYTRVVTWEGNRKAQEIMDQVFEINDAAWRGIGTIPASGLSIREEFADFDAERKFVMERGINEEPPGCSCGQIIKGVLRPYDCSLFSAVCTPGDPQGPCMVSSEGTCSAYYKYGGKRA